MMAARAGLCSECGEDVWLRDGGGCIRGHDPQSVEAARQVPLPPEIDKFNWGALFFPVLWPLFKGPAGWAGLFFLIGLVESLLGEVLPAGWWPLSAAVLAADLAVLLWYARNANRLLWEKTPWKVDQVALLKSQRMWGIVGLSITGVYVLLFGVYLAVV
ncbi:MAG: hypothetical protein ACYCX3_14165 [Thermoleophilia bacterium]